MGVKGLVNNNFILERLILNGKTKRLYYDRREKRDY